MFFLIFAKLRKNILAQDMSYLHWVFLVTTYNIYCYYMKHLWQTCFSFIILSLYFENLLLFVCFLFLEFLLTYVSLLYFLFKWIYRRLQGRFFCCYCFVCGKLKLINFYHFFQPGFCEAFMWQKWQYIINVSYFIRSFSYQNYLTYYQLVKEI